MEQQIKEFALVGFITALMASVGLLLFLNHDVLYEPPLRYVAFGYGWFLLMYLLYIRDLAKWAIKKEMGIQMKYMEELDGR